MVVPSSLIIPQQSAYSYLAAQPPVYCGMLARTLQHSPLSTTVCWLAGNVVFCLLRLVRLYCLSIHTWQFSLPSTTVCQLVTSNIASLPCGLLASSRQIQDTVSQLGYPLVLVPVDTLVCPSSSNLNTSLSSLLNLPLILSLHLWQLSSAGNVLINVY